MSKLRRVAIALELDQPYRHHHGIFGGTQQYADECERWQCIVDEHPCLRVRSRGELFQRYDGVIARVHPNLARRLKQLGIPFVNTWRNSPVRDVPSVYCDFEQVGRLAAEHLLNRGFRRFSYHGQEDYKHCELTAAGFAERVAEAGCECRIDFFPSFSFNAPDQWLKWERTWSCWLERIEPPTGMLVAVAHDARLVVNLCHNRNWRVPEDIAIICDHCATPAITDYPSPKLSSIDSNHERVGYEAARLLDQLMDGMPAPDEPILVAPRGLTARESTDCFVVDDELVAKTLRYIADHIDQRLSVRQIAATMFTSPRTLQMRFRDQLGVSISAEVRRLRLEAAKRLLAESDISIKQIARITGFGAPSVMREVFHRELALSPKSYRNEVTGENQKV